MRGRIDNMDRANEGKQPVRTSGRENSPEFLRQVSSLAGKAASRAMRRLRAREERKEAKPGDNRLRGKFRKTTKGAFGGGIRKPWEERRTMHMGGYRWIVGKGCTSHNF